MTCLDRWNLLKLFLACWNFTHLVLLCILNTILLLWQYLKYWWNENIFPPRQKTLTTYNASLHLSSDSSVIYGYLWWRNRRWKFPANWRKYFEKLRLPWKSVFVMNKKWWADDFSYWQMHVIYLVVISNRFATLSIRITQYSCTSRLDHVALIEWGLWPPAEIRAIPCKNQAGVCVGGGEGGWKIIWR